MRDFDEFQVPNVIRHEQNYRRTAASSMLNALDCQELPAAGKNADRGGQWGSRSAAFEARPTWRGALDRRGSQGAGAATGLPQRYPLLYRSNAPVRAA